MKSSELSGAVVMPRTPIVGSVWELREILPVAGDPYLASVERVRRDQEGRLLAHFRGEDGLPWEAEVWLARPGKLAP